MEITYQPYSYPRPGDCVYITANTVTFKIKQKSRDGKKEVDKSNVDEDLYPEFYRKSEYVKGNNFNTPDPFQVAIIKKIKKSEGEVSFENVV